MLSEVARSLSFVLRHPIGRRRPLTCLASLLVWQIRARLNPNARTVAYVGNLSLWARRGEAGVTGNIYVGLHEFKDMAFVAHVLRPGDLFADVGANVGSYAVLAAGFAGADVLAIEPVPEAFGRLEANLDLNGLAHLVQTKQCAAGSENGVIQISTARDTMNRVIDDPGSGTDSGVGVELQRLDDLCTSRAPRVIKIDVEGFEAEVLGGAQRLLADPTLKALIVELWDDTKASMSNVLQAAGFERFRCDPFARRLQPRFEEGEGNTIFLRDAAWIADRVTTAPRLSVKGLRV